MRRRARVVALGIGTLLLAGCSADSHLPISEQAAQNRLALRHGQVVARLCLPRFHSGVAVLDGFDQATINRGPGRFPGSRLPGEGRLIYIAGHHRTHGAPFQHIAELANGDRVVIITPATLSTIRTGKPDMRARGCRS